MFNIFLNYIVFKLLKSYFDLGYGLLELVKNLLLSLKLWKWPEVGELTIVLILALTTVLESNLSLDILPCLTCDKYLGLLGSISKFLFYYYFLLLTIDIMVSHSIVYIF